ncbi:MAG: hypothetical protein U0736_04605 [Gemmataceae bacterium]
MSAMQFRPVRVEDETSVQCQFQLESTGQNRFTSVLIARFSGDYKDGAAGHPDAVYMAGMLRMGIEMWGPAAVVLDLTDLRYEWGDEMLWLVRPAFHYRKMAIVVGRGCARAIATLMWGVSTNKKATEADFIFDDLEAAWEHVRNRQ